jgi:hypothetical protein
MTARSGYPAGDHVNDMSRSVFSAKEANGYVYLFNDAGDFIGALPSYAGLVDHAATTVRVRTECASILTLNTDGEIVREDFVGEGTRVLA